MKALLERAEREHAEDLATARQSPLWSPAVRFLREWLSPMVRFQIRELVDKQSRDWPVAYHSFWGMGVRNALRDRGFGEDALGVLNLDNVYVELVEEAVR